MCLGSRIVTAAVAVMACTPGLAKSCNVEHAIYRAEVKPYQGTARDELRIRNEHKSPTGWVVTIKSPELRREYAFESTFQNNTGIIYVGATLAEDQLSDA